MLSKLNFLSKVLIMTLAFASVQSMPAWAGDCDQLFAEAVSYDPQYELPTPEVITLLTKNYPIISSGRFQAAALWSARNRGLDPLLLKKLIDEEPHLSTSDKERLQLVSWEIWQKTISDLFGDLSILSLKGVPLQERANVKAVIEAKLVQAGFSGQDAVERYNAAVTLVKSIEASPQTKNSLVNFIRLILPAYLQAAAKVESNGYRESKIKVFSKYFANEVGSEGALAFGVTAVSSILGELIIGTLWGEQQFSVPQMFDIAGAMTAMYAGGVWGTRGGQVIYNKLSGKLKLQSAKVRLSQVPLRALKNPSLALTDNSSDDGHEALALTSGSKPITFVESEIRLSLLDREMESLFTMQNQPESQVRGLVKRYLEVSNMFNTELFYEFTGKLPTVYLNAVKNYANYFSSIGDANLLHDTHLQNFLSSINYARIEVGRNKYQVASWSKRIETLHTKITELKRKLSSSMLIDEGSVYEVSLQLLEEAIANDDRAFHASLARYENQEKLMSQMLTLIGQTPVPDRLESLRSGRISQIFHEL